MNMYICELCKLFFNPIEIKGVIKLKTFRGYTIDFRLQQFRKVKYGRVFEFIDFESSQGVKLLAKMHELTTR